MKTIEQLGMNERIKKLRKQSVGIEPSISIERAELVTEAYKKYQGKVSITELRALTFKHILENKELVINEGELIVGERGPSPQATPTYPEICCHTLEDFEQLDKRERTFYRVSEEANQVQKDTIIPFWKDRTINDIIMKEMPAKWNDCFDAGIFTEFMLQRAPGHVIVDGKIFKKGMLDFKNDIKQRLEEIDYLNDFEANQKKEQLKAMDICCDAIIIYANRYAAYARKLADQTLDEGWKKDLLQIAADCDNVPANAPTTFRQALQMYWFIHVGIITELNPWDACTLGRPDIHLYPFYKNDVEKGMLDRDGAKELLESFWIKFNNQPAPTKVGVTLKESATYTDFCNMNIGGINPDGSDGSNEISYLMLEVLDDLELVQPSMSVLTSYKNPDKLLVEAARVIRGGTGLPSIFNNECAIESLIRQGKSVQDAREGGVSGCAEPSAFGKEADIETGYFNLIKVFEVTMHNGVDPSTGKQIGPKTGDPREFANMEDLMDAYEKQIKYFVDVKIEGNNIIEQIYARYMPAPFTSITFDDCIKRAKDYNDGGPRYNTRYIMIVGLGSLIDSLSSLNKHIFEDKNMDMDYMLEILNNDFEGYEKERNMFLTKTPKYGNDDDDADVFIDKIFNIVHDAIDSRPTVCGGHHRAMYIPTTCHIYFGEVSGAIPDGRKAGMPLSEGISPVQGADTNGPTAIVKSAAKLNQASTSGTLLNQKFSPKLLENENGLEMLTKLVRVYFKSNGFHMQFNVVTGDELRAAKENPEEYNNLIVRIAGYSDYFNNLTDIMKDEIIARREQETF